MQTNRRGATATNPPKPAKHAPLPRSFPSTHLSPLTRPISALLSVLCACTLSPLLAGESSVAIRKSSTEIRTEKTVSTKFFDGAPTEHLTLQQAVQMALSNNLDVKFENVGIGIERSRVRFAAGAFDPEFSINANYQSIRQLENVNEIQTADAIRQREAIASNFAIAQQIFDQNNIARAQQGLPAIPVSERPTLSRELTTAGLSATTFSNVRTAFDAGLIGRTPWGMRYGLQVQASRLQSTFTGDTRHNVPEYSTVAQLTIVQPLLRNFGTSANLAELRIARLGQQIQVLQWKERLNSAVQGVMSAYYDMVFALRDMRVREDAVAAGQRLIDLYRRRVELGFNSPIDVQQAEVQVSAEREQMILSKNVFLERQFALKRLILNQYKIEDPRIFVPESAPSLDATKLDRVNLLRTAFEKRYDYKQALLNADAQDVRLKYARNQLLPQLDLVASYGLNGLGTSIGASIDQGVGGHTPSWSVGLNFSVPLGNVQPRANYRVAQGLKEQALLRIKQAEVTVGSDVDQIISRIETSRQRLTTAIQTRQLAEETVRVAFRRLEEGLISSFDIIEFQRRLYDAKSRELGAQADLSRSITQLWLVTSTVLDHAGVGFSEPLKPY